MTIDERLEKLAERHQALTESVEMMRASQAQKSEETDRRFKQVADLFAETDGFIRTLAEIAQRREARLDRLDGGGN